MQVRLIFNLVGQGVIALTGRGIFCLPLDRFGFMQILFHSEVGYGVGWGAGGALWGGAWSSRGNGTPYWNCCVAYHIGEGHNELLKLICKSRSDSVKDVSGRRGICEELPAFPWRALDHHTMLTLDFYEDPRPPQKSEEESSHTSRRLSTSVKEKQPFYHIHIYSSIFALFLWPISHVRAPDTRDVLLILGKPQTYMLAPTQPRKKHGGTRMYIVIIREAYTDVEREKRKHRHR